MEAGPTDRGDGRGAPAPVRRIPIARPSIGPLERRYVLECLDSGWVSSKGPYLHRFEEAISGYLACREAVAVSSGTTGLHVALALFDLGPADEVIVPTFTMIACANAVTYVGARLVLADSDERTWSISADEVERRLTGQTRAIIVPHLYGFPADLDPILDLARTHRLRVVEDAAEALGTTYRGRKVGPLGDVGVLSFYANKIVTTGEGGAVITNEPALAARARGLCDQGYDPDQRAHLLHREVGFNYRMTSLQAAMGIAQMERAESMIEHHVRIAATYRAVLANVPGIVLPPESPESRNVFWMYTVRFRADEFGSSRDDVMRQLAGVGIETRSSFWPVHRQPPYLDRFGGGSFPTADTLATEGLNLPSGNSTTLEEAAIVAEQIAGLARR